MMNYYPREKQLFEYFMGQTFTSLLQRGRRIPFLLQESSNIDQLITSSSLKCALYTVEPLTQHRDIARVTHTISSSV